MRATATRTLLESMAASTAAMLATRAALPPEKRKHFKRHEYQQRPEWDWFIWVLEGGRGSGKTRTGSEEVFRHIEEHGGPECHIGVGAPTKGDVRKVCFEEESGILGTYVGRAHEIVQWNRQGLEAWHVSGAKIDGFGSEAPGRWNGRNFCFIWHDEGSLQNPEALTQSMLALRKKWIDKSGNVRQPQMIITTTPKPSRHIREWKTQPTTAVTRGSMFDNIANLSDAMVAELKRRYEGTILARRELYGEDIDQVDGALWNYANIEAHRVAVAPLLSRVVVAIDPAASHGEDSDETGISVVGRGEDGDLYVLDISGFTLSPNGWANKGIDAYEEHEADRIVGEKNNGGEMVRETIATAAKARGLSIPVALVHASRGKTTRAEPVAALYEQGKVHHVGTSPQMVKSEDQMCVFPVTNEKDDRVDSLVWAIKELTGTVSMKAY